MKTYGGVDVWIHILLTSAIVGGEWSASHPCRFTPEKSPRYPFYRKLGRPQSRSGRHGEVNIFDPTGTRTPASRYFFFNLHIVGGGVQTGSTRHRGHLLSYCACPGWLWGWRIIRWNEDWQGKPKHSEKTCPSATLSTTNPTWTDPGSNPARRGGKSATNSLSYDAA
jgi:hypothetical protein